MDNIEILRKYQACSFTYKEKTYVYCKTTETESIRLGANFIYIENRPELNTSEGIEVLNAIKKLKLFS